ncbi:MAG: hypothetical protein R6X32_16870, partial [Chloroflexota bacterium]
MVTRLLSLLGLLLLLLTACRQGPASPAGAWSEKGPPAAVDIPGAAMTPTAVSALAGKTSPPPTTPTVTATSTATPRP